MLEHLFFFSKLISTIFHIISSNQQPIEVAILEHLFQAFINQNRCE